jgi:hypothetical protein
MGTVERSRRWREISHAVLGSRPASENPEPIRKHDHIASP